MTKQKPLVVGIAGYGRVGKDTFADLAKEHLKDNVTSAKYKFAEQVRIEACKKRPDLEPIMWSEDPKDKEQIRPLLVEIGGGYRKDDPDIWVKHLIRQVREAEEDIRFIPDVRYINEAKAILSDGGFVVLVNRSGYGPINEEEAKTTSQLYDPGSNPLFTHPNFRIFWWTYPLKKEYPVSIENRKARELENMGKAIPELTPFLAPAATAVS